MISNNIKQFSTWLAFGLYWTKGPKGQILGVVCQNMPKSQICVANILEILKNPHGAEPHSFEEPNIIRPSWPTLLPRSTLPLAVPPFSTSMQCNLNISDQPIY